MRIEVLIEGGTLQVPNRVNAPFSTVVLLWNDERKVLIDPGSLVVAEVLEEKLEDKGISPEDITDIILTHFHLDHAYNSVYFTEATVHIHKNYALKDYSKFGPIIGREYLRIMNSWKRVSTLENEDVIFGRIKVYHTPWHAREHVSLVIDTDNMGKVFLPGDICFTRLNYFEIIKGYRDDKVAEFVKKISSQADLIVFTHDSPIEPL